MTSTGKSNTDLIAEAVSAIGPWRAWLGNKRGEIQGQIVQMHAAAVPPTNESALATRLRSITMPTTGGIPTPADVPTVAQDTADADTTATTDTASAHATVPDGAGETDSAGNPSVPEEPIGMPSTPSTGRTTTCSPSLPTLQNASEAQAYLETVFTATPPHTLPPRVVTAWEGRTTDTKYNARMLIGAKEAGVLSAELAHAVSAMIAFDSEFAAMYALYPEGLYKELFDIGLGEHGPTNDEADQAELAADGDTEKGEGDEEEAETEQEWGFPGEDTHERPF